MADSVQVDLMIDKGADYAVQIYWTDQYDDALPVKHPMKMMVKNAGGATVNTYISTSDSPGGGALQYLSYNTDAGFIQLSLPDSHTNALSAGIYYYDLWAEVDDPDDAVNLTKRSKIIGGQFIVSSAITTF